MSKNDTFRLFQNKKKHTLTHNKNKTKSYNITEFLTLDLLRLGDAIS